MRLPGSTMDKSCLSKRVTPKKNLKRSNGIKNSPRTKIGSNLSSMTLLKTPKLKYLLTGLKPEKI